MEVTKKKAAEVLGISMAEVVRRIDRGELKARKKTASKFSDFVITLPDEKEETTLTQQVEEQLETKVEPETTIEPEPVVEPETTVEPEPEPEPEPIEEPVSLEDVKREHKPVKVELRKPHTKPKITQKEVKVEPKEQPATEPATEPSPEKGKGWWY